jgi:hypothetical protein
MIGPPSAFIQSLSGAATGSHVAYIYLVDLMTLRLPLILLAALLLCFVRAAQQPYDPATTKALFEDVVFPFSQGLPEVARKAFRALHSLSNDGDLASMVQKIKAALPAGRPPAPLFLAHAHAVGDALLQAMHNGGSPIDQPERMLQAVMRHEDLLPEAERGSLRRETVQALVSDSLGRLDGNDDAVLWGLHGLLHATFLVLYQHRGRWPPLVAKRLASLLLDLGELTRKDEEKAGDLSKNCKLSEELARFLQAMHVWFQAAGDALPFYESMAFLIGMGVAIVLVLVADVCLFVFCGGRSAKNKAQ